MSRETDETEGAPLLRTDLTCLGCGCLCDDISVEMAGREVRRAENLCHLGRGWFSVVSELTDAPQSLIQGVVADPEAALERAAELLRSSQAPVVFGLTQTVTEAVRAALGLADGLGARVVLNRTENDLAGVAAFQTVGRVSATLGEVKARADVVVFWGVDPSVSHPRHGERYSTDPTGRFVPSGRAGRSVIVVGDPSTATARAADLVAACPPGRDRELLSAIRAAVRHRAAGREFQPGEPAGVSAETIGQLVDRLTGANYGALFYQPRGDSPRDDWQQAYGMVRELNGLTRFVVLGMGGPGNATGAEAALTWQAGYPQGVDFGPGYPAALDARATLESILAAGATDLVLAVADPWPAGLSAAALRHLAAVPTVVIGPAWTANASPAATVRFRSAAVGLEVAGSVTRVDGATLPLRPVRESAFPTEVDWLTALAARLGLAVSTDYRRA